MNTKLPTDIKKLGFGLMRLPMLNGKVDIEQTEQMVDLFMENGFTYFDTAYGYIGGASETAIKTALVDRYSRDSFQLATKLPAWAAASAEDAKQMLWTSLERTGAGYFDFYLLHNLGGDRHTAFERYGIWEFLAEQKRNGVIRQLGFSAHASADYLEKLLDQHPDVDFVQLQINYADWENGIVQSRRCYETAVAHGKPVIVMEPVKGGALSSLPAEAESVFKALDENASVASYAIRFAASLDGVLTVLSGMSSLAQMEDNVSYMRDFRPLDEAEREAVRRVQHILTGIERIPCTDCRYCEKGCPKHVAIPGIFKNYNDYLLHGDIALIRGDYEWQVSGSNGNRATECIECGACERVCPQSIPIIEALKKASAVFDRDNPVQGAGE
ncbi:MAG: aldo/keto reductase [Clostridia bacterium]|nr:aldo/keto reductase [Clostridia bacterium]